MRHIVFALALWSCHHEDAPQPKLEPGETLPLPPASGTPIGFLVDDAADLALKDEQVAQLKAIDQSLQAQLDAIDTQLRGYDARPPSQAPSGARQGGRYGGGRRGGAGMGGAPPQQNGGQRVNHAPGATTGSGAVAHADDIARLNEQRKSDVKDALGKAFALFDVPQRILARKALAKHDIDLDAPDKPAGPAAPEAEGEGGEP